MATYCCQAHCDAHWPLHRSLCGELRRPEKRYTEAGLYSACLGNRHEEVGKMLQQRGLDVNWAQPDGGATAAYVAAKLGHYKCLSLLRQHSADLSKPTKDGCAPIHIACWFGRSTCLATLLLDQGVDIDHHTANKFQETPAMLCCSGGMVKCLALLLDRQPDLNLVDCNVHTAAHKACAFNQAKCLQLLIKRGVIDINKVDKNGLTVLDCARRYGHRDCVDLLLENGAVGMREEKIVPFSDTGKVCKLE